MPGDFFPGGSKPAGINILIVQAFTERRGSVIETLTLKEGELFPSDLGQAAGSQDPALSVRTVRAAEGGRRLADQPVHLQRCGGDHQCEPCEREPDLQGVGGDGNPHPGARTLLHPGPGGAAAPGGTGLRVSLPPGPADQCDAENRRQAFPRNRRARRWFFLPLLQERAGQSGKNPAESGS